MFEGCGMVIAYDRLTDELQRSCVRLTDELIFSPQRYGDETFFHIEIPSSSAFFRIGYVEYVFVSQLDGNTTLATALAVTAQSQGANSLNEQQATQIVSWLLENGMANFADADISVDAKQLKQQKTTWIQQFNPFWIKIPLGNPSQLLDSALPFFRWMFHPVAIIACLLIIIAGIATANSNWEAFSNSFNLFSQYNWIWMLASWVVLKIVHEMAHGLACRFHGGEVSETGAVFILLAPMAYVDVTSSWRFSSRWKRIVVAGAGMYIELIIASFCIFGWLATNSEIAKQLLFNVFFMAGVSTVLFNANPLMKFDGYFILSDLLKIPNLYTNGSTRFRQQAAWLFYGQQPEKSGVEIRNHRHLISVYGWLASAWKVLICVTLSITASAMFGGFGVLLAAFGMIGWVAKPSIEIFKDFENRRNSKPHSVVRAALIVASFASILTASWFFIPNPFAVRTPCLVDFEYASKVRANAPGFVETIYVENGQFVDAGQPLLTLRNMELVATVAESKARLEKEKTQERVALDKQEPADAQIARRNQEATKKLLAERTAELKQLTLTAPTSGRVVALHLEQMIGRYITKGEIVLSIGNDNNKEIVISIAPGDVRSSEELIGKTVPIEIGSRRKRLARIERIAPRASTQVGHPCLIAANGGPIAVKENEDFDKETDGSAERYKYCDPRFHAIAKLDASAAQILQSGETGFAVLNSNNQTLGKWLVSSTYNWLQDQLQLAQVQ